MRIPYKKAIGSETKPGRPSIGKKPDKSELTKLYIKEIKSIREIAKLLNCSKDMVHRSLKEHGIDRRPKIKSSVLSVLEIDKIRAMVKDMGLRKTSKILGISHVSLWEYLKRREKKS